MRRDALYLLGVGAQTPVGRSVLPAAAAVRCGLSCFTEHPYMRDKWGEAMVVARAKWLDIDLPVEGRLVALAAGAIREALGAVYLGAHAKVAIHLALPAESVRDAGAAERIAAAILIAADDPRLDRQATIVLEGHAGGYSALAGAAADLRAGRATACLVGGVDSAIDADRLEALDHAGRLHSTGTRWGFTPGEAAGFCLLATGATAVTLGTPRLAELQSVATAHELALLGSTAVNLGAGLSSAFRAVLGGEDRVHHTYCDLNGEMYRADELAFAIARNSDRFVEVTSRTTAASSWGDVGAASGPLAWALAAAAWCRGYARGPVALTWASSAHLSLRGAAIFKGPSREEGMR